MALACAAADCWLALLAGTTPVQGASCLVAGALGARRDRQLLRGDGGLTRRRVPRCRLLRRAPAASLQSPEPPRAAGAAWTTRIMLQSRRQGPSSCARGARRDRQLLRDLRDCVRPRLVPVPAQLHPRAAASPARDVDFDYSPRIKILRWLDLPQIAVDPALVDDGRSSGAKAHTAAAHPAAGAAAQELLRGPSPVAPRRLLRGRRRCGGARLGRGEHGRRASRSGPCRRPTSPLSTTRTKKPPEPGSREQF
jgi:hypothetical protein